MKRFQEGDIWPENDVIVTVFCCPNKATNLTSTAYCEVSGRSDRLPLKLEGTGLGPKFELNIKSFDLKKIYIYSTQCFEVCVVNQGKITRNYYEHFYIKK